MFLKNKNFIFKIRRSKVTDYAALNADLFSVNIVLYSNCRCGAQFETAEHYLLECRLYCVQRQRLKNNLNPDFELNFD